jgi:hypothetical protein
LIASRPLRVPGGCRVLLLVPGCRVVREVSGDQHQREFFGDGCIDAENNTVITGEIKSQVDKVWNAFWTGGISNPLEVIEQITYLLFLKRLDENQTRAENKANRTGKPVENPVFPLRPG